MDFYTVNEVAKKLRTTRAFVAKLINSKQLKAHKVGRAYRIKPADYEAYVKSTEI